MAKVRGGKRNVRRSDRSGQHRPFFTYSEHQMSSAINELRDGKVAVRVVARKYNVPPTMLTRGLKSNRLEKKMGPQPVLQSIENQIVECLFTLADAGFPISKNQLLDNVANYLNDNNIPNTFKNGRPGRKWFDAFRNRHANVSFRVAQNITRARSSVTEQRLRSWFENVRLYYV